MRFSETYVVDAASIRKTNDGYLTAMPRVARTGIQIYSGRETGKPNMERVRVYRPESEVFSRDMMHSLAHKPVTVDHPPVLVTADNWRKFAVGQTGDEVVRDGDVIRVPMVLMDSAAIRSFEGGKQQLSVGYTCDLKWEEGTAPNGETYDAIQTNIRANHVAVVKNARGGPDLKFGDGACPECGAEMRGKKCLKCGYKADAATADDGGKGDLPMKKIVVDGITVELELRDAEIVERTLASLIKQVKDAKDETEEEHKKRLAAEEKMKTDAAVITTKDAEIVTLKKQVEDAQITPEKMAAFVRDHVAITGKAKAVLGDSVSLDGMSTEQIKKTVVNTVVGDAAKEWGDKEIAASFASITAQVKTGDASNLAAAFKGDLGDALVTDADKAWNENVSQLTNAWKRSA